MRVVEIQNGLLLEDVQHFDARNIFECGQCFRWKKEADDSYTGVAYGKVLNVKSDYDHGTVVLNNTTREDFEEIWYSYFDLGRDYGSIKEALAQDEILKSAIEYGRGIRILNQEPWELLISFIISANNNIPRISKSIDALSQMFGEAIKYSGKLYYSFPAVNKLGQAELKQIDMCGTGYRCKYLYQTSRMINSGEIDLEAISKLRTEEAKKELLRLSGVGPKVADCILLFSMQKHDTYPIDVWVKRVTEHFYIHRDVSMMQIQEFAKERFGKLAGFAQQYLFYFAREQKIK
ncbi:MAG: 8-oxoguanine DNA glycosylase [Clostridiales bacterium GWB2_37_7]|nr:MAG: 8-oxoguanine DNA glycosylase [Clostridiales bacterium GWB2_37_7]